MKVCPGCKKQWPDDFEGCPECGHDLTNVAVQANVNMGNANAISGGVHSADDHSVHDSNNQTNSNNASNSYNTTNNTTINEAQKSESELLNENILAYRMKCKELFDDGLISSSGESQLRELQVRLHLADEIALPIKDEIRLQSKKRKKQLSQVGKQEVNQTKAIIEQNTTQALHRQLAKLEAWMQEYDDESLKSVYYQMSSVLKPVEYTNRYEDDAKDEYWEVYWAYIAYMLQNRVKEAGAAIASLGRWHNKFPEQNDIILHLAGQLMQNESMDSAQQMRSALPAHYSADLQLLLDSIDELLQKDYEKESVIIRPVHAFYINTLFTEFLDTQKANGQQRLDEAKKRKEQEEQDKIRQQHEQQLAQQAAAKAKAEADAEAARLATERQNAENLAKAQELANQQREAQEAAAVAAKAEAERIEQERIAAAEEEARRREEEKRRKKDARNAWWGRNIWYVLGAVLVITVVVVLSIVLPRKIKEHRDAEVAYQKSIDNYKALDTDCRHNIESCSSDNLVPLDSAAHQLVRIIVISKELEQEQAEVDQLRVMFVEKANNLKSKCDMLENTALSEIRAGEQRKNRQLIESLLVYIK